MFFFRRHKSLPTYVQTYLDAPRPDDNLPWRSVPYSVLDIETTGLNPKRDSILAVGIVEIEEGRIQMGKRWYTMMRPPTIEQVGADSIRIHGLLRKELSEAPSADEVFPQLVQRLTGRVLVVHMAAIDVQFLNRAMRTRYEVKLRGPAIDTARLEGMLMHQDRFMSGKEFHGEPQDMSLRGLAQKANVPVHAQHHALSDALTTAQLFLAQVTRLQKRGFDTFRKLMRVGGCLK